jgi:hypothetical protein
MDQGATAHQSDIKTLVDLAQANAGCESRSAASRPKPEANDRANEMCRTAKMAD